MPKIEVTEGLAQTIKMLRNQNGIKSKDLAEAINKTPGYITKLEKKELKTIDLELVDIIFSILLGDDYQKTETWENIYTTLQIKLSRTEIEYEVWFANFDTVYRHIPVPDELIDFLNEKIVSLNIDRDYLLERINANEALSEEELQDESLKSNVWYQSIGKKGVSIKIDMPREILFDFLDKKEDSFPYVFVFCILYYLLKIEKYGDVVYINEPQIAELNSDTTAILNEYKFYSIVERENLVSTANTHEEIQSILSSFDNENIKLVSELLNMFKFASDMNVRVTNERLSSFIRNLENDLWFVMKIISLDYQSLESIEFEQKREFIGEIETLIKKFSSVQKAKKDMETY